MALTKYPDDVSCILVQTIVEGENVHEVYWSANGQRLGLRGNNPQSINQLSPGTVSVVKKAGEAPESWFVPGGFGLVNDDGVPSPFLPCVACWFTFVHLLADMLSDGSGSHSHG